MSLTGKCIVKTCNCRPNSLYFCIEHLRSPRVSYSISKFQNFVIINGTSFLLKEGDNRQPIIYGILDPMKREVSKLTRRHLVDLRRIGIRFTDVLKTDTLACDKCHEDESKDRPLTEYSCGHFFHRECSSDFCIICENRGSCNNNDVSEHKCIACTEIVEEDPLECGHFVHRNCVARWGQEKCPVCKVDITLPPELQEFIKNEQEKKKQEQVASDRSEAIRVQRMITLHS
jgi:Zinc finger, C3HC4 type (RING finger)